MPDLLASTSGRPQTRGWLRRLAPWVAAAAAIAVYLNALHNGFALDDLTVIAKNPLVLHTASWRDIWVSDYWPNMPYQIGLYRPLTIFIYALQWAAWHGNPAGFHAVNVLVHAAVCALIVILMLRLGAPPVAAAVGGVLFAVHPVHVEAVSGVVGFAEIGMTLLVVAACLLHLQRAWPPVVRWAGIAACFLAALLIKESAVSLPLLLVVVDGLDPSRRRPLRRVLWDDAPLYLLLAAVLAGYLGLRYAVLGVFGGSMVAPALVAKTASTRVATAVSAWIEYLRLFVWPRDLVADYSPNVLVALGWTSGKVWAGMAVGAATLAGAVVSRRRAPWWTAAVAWFAASVFVVSNLVVPVGVVLAERTLYLPSVSLALVAVPLVAVGRRHRRLAASAGVVALMLAVIRTWTRTPVWKSTPALLSQMAQAHPESVFAQSYLGDEAMRAQNLPAAVAHYSRAWALVPNPPIGASYAHALALSHRWADAERIARQVCAPALPSACLDLVDVLLAQHRPLEARAVVDSLALHVPPSPPLSERERRVRQALADSARR